MSNQLQELGLDSGNEFYPSGSSCNAFHDANGIENLSYGLASKSSTSIGESHSQLISDYQSRRTAGWIEQSGNIDVYKTTLGNYYAYDGNSYNQIDTFQDSGGWSIIGAETINGSNQVAFHHASSNQFYKWNTDSNWDHISGDYVPIEETNVDTMPWEVD